MKKIFTLLLITILTTISVLAQETIIQNYRFDKITGISAGYAFKVEITKGKSDKIEVVCPSYLEKYMDIKSIDGILYLKMNLPKDFTHPNNCSGEVSVKMEMETINTVNLSGAASFYAKGEFTTDNLKCNLSGASRISSLNISGKLLNIEASGAINMQQNGNFTKLDMECSGAGKITLNGNIDEISSEISGASLFHYTGNSENVDIEASGASKAILTGKCEFIKIECSGASNINAKAMISQNATAEASGVSKISVYSSKILKADSSVSSNINYYGNPKQVISKPKNIRKAD